MNYNQLAKIFKALSDKNRVKIVDLLSAGEKCACDLLDQFEFSQPTLSHHMKVLIEANIVIARKSGKWQHYSLNVDFVDSLDEQIKSLLLEKIAN
ncbi:ArsR family transcriptional regulator [Liquorilactobacillus satsumensis]|nr:MULTISPECIES: metalloregulator ArsR/SmtB family transcription factor [Lactobacillaceae]MCC7667825.1 ArsR family transcriptional regulator [Liquorilactobacillus satsumensis]